MDVTQFETGGGIRVTRTAAPFDPALLAEMTQAVEARRGGVLSSGMEYPGRYSRWHMAYVDPAIELVARGRRVTATALNQRGLVLLPAVRAAMGRAGRGRRGRCRRPRGGADPGGGRTLHRGGTQPPAHGVLGRARDHRGLPRPGSAPRPVRGVRLRPGVPVRAGPARGTSARPASVTWCCTCRTGSTCWTASGRPRPASATTSRPGAPRPRACPAMAVSPPRRGPGATRPGRARPGGAGA